MFRHEKVFAMERNCSVGQKSYNIKFFSFCIRNFVTPIIESVPKPARITPYPTGRLFGAALSQALRARLRSHRPSGTFRNRLWLGFGTSDFALQVDYDVALRLGATDQQIALAGRLERFGLVVDTGRD